MPETDPNLEWQRLNAFYAQKGDQDLLELREDFDDLTEIAKEALRRELRARQLWVEAAPKPVAVPVEPEGPATEADDDDLMWDWEDLQRGGVAVAECETTDEAELYCHVLRLAKIQSGLLRPQAGIDIRPPRVIVAPDDVERAREALYRPIPNEVRREFEELPEPGDFEVPECLRCRSTDILLEGTEPMNKWLCENCGARWNDTVPEGTVEG